MIRLLQLIIFGHYHKWKIIKEEPYKTWEREVGKGPVVAQGTHYTLQCESCGNIKGHKD